MRPRLPLVVLVLLSAFASPLHAGAWTRASGGWFAALTFDHWFTQERFGAEGEKKPVADQDPAFDPPEYRSQALHGYFEYGLTDDWTAIGGASFAWVENQAAGKIDSNRGLSDFSLQLKRRLLAAPIVVSVAAETRFPAGYDATKLPALGPGEVDVGGRLAMGGGLGRLYATGEVGFNARGGAARADEIPFGIEAGYHVLRDLLVRAELRGTSTVGTPSPTSQPFDPALADSRYVSAGAAIALLGNPLDLVFGVEHALGGRNTLAGTKLRFAVWSSR